MSVMQLLLSLVRDIPAMVSDRVHLAALELRRARHALVRMIALLIVAAILVMAAWFALWAAIAVTLLSSGIPIGLVFVLVLLCNGLGGWFALLRASSLVEDLALPATVRQLTLPSQSGDNGETQESRSDFDSGNATQGLGAGLSSGKRSIL